MYIYFAPPPRLRAGIPVSIITIIVDIVFRTFRTTLYSRKRPSYDFFPFFAYRPFYPKSRFKRRNKFVDKFRIQRLPPFATKPSSAYTIGPGDWFTSIPLFPLRRIAAVENDSRPPSVCTARFISSRYLGKSTGSTIRPCKHVTALT